MWEILKNKMINLTNQEKTKIDNWLSALGMGLTWNEKENRVGIMGNGRMEDVEIEKNGYGMYAIFGNCSLKLRDENGNKIKSVYDR